MANFVKILPAVAEMLHADLRTDRQTDVNDEANNRFSQFCERAKNIIWKPHKKKRLDILKQTVTSHVV